MDRLILPRMCADCTFECAGLVPNETPESNLEMLRVNFGINGIDERRKNTQIYNSMNRILATAAIAAIERRIQF